MPINKLILYIFILFFVFRSISAEPVIIRLILTANTKNSPRMHDMLMIDEDFGCTVRTERREPVFLKAGLHLFRLYYIIVTQDDPSLDFE